MSNEERTQMVDEQENPKLKGKKSMRGEPEMYDEIKEIVSHSLTPTARKGLEILSKALGISRSELVEQVGRGMLKVTGLEPLYEEYSGFFPPRD